MPTIDRNTILDLETRLIEAIKTSDVNWLDQHLHDELLFMVPGGQIITKQTDLEAHRSGAMVVEHLVPDFEKIRVVDDTAIVTVVYDTKGIMTGTPIKGKFRYIRTWKKFPDGLKVVSGACFMLD